MEDKKDLDNVNDQTEDLHGQEAQMQPLGTQKVYMPPRRDKSFYLEPVTFLVGNTLFKVSKSGFMVPGTIFEAMFSLPTDETLGESNSVEGSSDENPIHLHGIDEKKFRAFLTILYPAKGGPVGDEETLYRTLIGALHLATFWEFTELRREIITSLSPIIEKRDKVEVIFISKKYRVAAWLRACYKKLIWPSIEQLPIDELTSAKFPMDWETLAKIYHIRDIIVRDSLVNKRCTNCNTDFGPSYAEPHRFSCECRVTKLIETHFHKEFNSMEESLSDFLEPPSLST